MLGLSRSGGMRTLRMCPSLKFRLNTWASSASNPWGPDPHQGLDDGDLVVISDSEDDSQDLRLHLSSSTEDEDLDPTNIIPSPQVQTTTSGEGLQEHCCSGCLLTFSTSSELRNHKVDYCSFDGEPRLLKRRDQVHLERLRSRSTVGRGEGLEKVRKGKSRSCASKIKEWSLQHPSDAGTLVRKRSARIRVKSDVIIRKGSGQRGQEGEETLVQSALVVKKRTRNEVEEFLPAAKVLRRSSARLLREEVATAERRSERSKGGLPHLMGLANKSNTCYMLAPL